MKCEVEFMPVGSGSKAGDAIVIRYGEPSAYGLAVVDGGTVESGDAVVAHIQKHFGANATVEHVVLTHPDGDHASGIRPILNGLPVANLWMHIPWLHAQDALPYFAKKDWTVESLTAAIKKEYDLLDEIVTTALAKSVTIHGAFQGEQIGPFTVLSPPRAFYRFLMPQFDRTPAPDQEAIESAGLWIGKGQGALAKAMDAILAKAQTWIKEDWNTEWLKDGGVTSATNETSAILYGSFEHGRILLTADAGTRALTWGLDYLQSAGLPAAPFRLIQIPHHGSRRNVGPTLLNRLIGPKLPKGSASTFEAFVSAPKDDATHPRKMVTNAFMRRGGRVLATQGKGINLPGGFPRKDGYVDAVALEFATDVEDYT